MAGKNLHPNTAKIELNFPITIAGVETGHLIMRRPKLRDDLAASKAGGSEEDQSIFLVANLCEITQEELLELDASDWTQVQEAVAGFRQAKPQKTS
jgi:hypothetical protein